jgi:Icc-related predicted phosphoesterase
MKITAISDLHGDRPKLNGGDLLIIAGDLTARDTEDEYYQFNSWMCNQEYNKKIVIAGNHDMLIQKDSFQYLEGYPAFDYLQDSGIEIEYKQIVEEDHKFKGSISYIVKKKLKIWGTPWTQWFQGVNPSCSAFMLRNEFELKERFDLIPEDIDILISHGPCFERLDKTIYGDHVGSKALRDCVDVLKDKQLKYHFHGHIHEGYGRHQEGGLCTFNVSRMDINYIPKNKILNIEI